MSRDQSEGAADSLMCYVIDGDDRIESVSGPWDAFATANGAPALTAASVVGRPLTTFITDLTTSHIYQRIVSRVRDEQRMVPLALRCDGPSCRRWLRLTVHPQSDRRVRFESRIVREEPREPVMLLDRSIPRTGHPMRVCSWCDSVHTPRGWRELEVGVLELGLFDSGPLPPITHSICPVCASEYDFSPAA
jgi:hypothetical protein